MSLGHILIHRNLIEESQLQELLELKSKESIYDCFLWTAGEFAFEDDQLPERVPVSFSLDLTSVYHEGIARMDRWEQIRQAFPSRLTTFTLNKEAVEAEDPDSLSEEDRRILNLIDRGRNLSEIALELHAVDFYAASRLLGFYKRNLIQVADVPKELPYERQVEELRNRLREGLISFNTGRHQRALSAFEAAVEIDPQSRAHLFIDKITRIVEDAKPEAQISLDAVPMLKVSLAELKGIELTPQEGFVLSRISGEWDVRSILKICPLTKEDVLNIFNKLRDDNLIAVSEKKKSVELK